MDKICQSQKLWWLCSNSTWQIVVCLAHFFSQVFLLDIQLLYPTREVSDVLLPLATWATHFGGFSPTRHVPGHCEQYAVLWSEWLRVLMVSTMHSIPLLQSNTILTFIRSTGGQVTSLSKGHHLGATRQLWSYCWRREPIVGAEGKDEMDDSALQAGYLFEAAE